MVDNSIKVGGNMTGNIQHSSPGGTQSFRLNVESARNSLDALEAELAKIAINDHAQLKEIAGDVATMKGQLLKASPSLPICTKPASRFEKSQKALSPASLPIRRCKLPLRYVVHLD